jgi:hypothetical protein
MTLILVLLLVAVVSYRIGVRHERRRLIGVLTGLATNHRREVDELPRPYKGV